jgi:hypothetical protein
MTKQNKYLYPFVYLGGARAMYLGLLFMFVGSALSYNIGYRYDGLIDYHFYGQSILWYLLDPFISWVLLSFSFCIIGGLFKAKFRWVDVWGMLAFAFLPQLLMPLVSLGFDLQKVYSGMANDMTPSDILAVLQSHILPIILSSILMLASLVWYIYLIWHAYKVNFSLKQPLATILFIVVVLVIEFVSVYIIRLY